MATVTYLRDDLLHAQGQEYVGQDVDEHEFSLDGVTYLIDVNSENWQRLCDALADYIEHARKVGTRRGRPKTRIATAGTVPASTTTPTAPKPRADKEQMTAIREWARRFGVQVNDRGRIKAEIVEAYHAGDEEAMRTLAANQAAAGAPAPATDVPNGVATPAFSGAAL